VLKALCRNAIKSFSIGMTLILASGCTLVKPDPLPTIPSLGSTPSHPSSLNTQMPSGTPSGRWHGLRSTCPVVEQELPGLPGIVGEGYPEPEYLDMQVALSATCSWRRGNNGRPTMRALVSVYRDAADGPGKQKAINIFRRLRKESEEALKRPGLRLPRDEHGVGEEAFLTVHPEEMRISLRARSENAVVILNIWLKDDWDYDDRRRIELVSAQRSNIIALMGDVLDDLR